MDLTKKRAVGRPLKHTTDVQKKAANALAAKAYRERKKAKLEQWRDLRTLPKSSVIDLSELLPPWRAAPR